MSSLKKPKMDFPGGVAEFPYDAATFKITEEMQQAYDWDGVIKVKKMFSDEEVEKITTSLVNNHAVTDRAWDLSDGHGRATRMVLWNQPGNDITGMVARVERVVNTCEALAGGEVYHYHTKLMMKEARTGGKTLWHQDYGYWYKNGCLKPDLITAFIALDPCTKENGSLQVVKGTHRCGRIVHDLVAGQTVANQERVDFLVKHFEHVHANLQPGDALFFHCNVLHTSDKNDSDMRRYAFLVAYNRADNDPVVKHHHPQYTPLEKVPDSAIMACTNYTDLTGKDFMDPSQDKTVKATLVKSGFH